MKTYEVTFQIDIKEDVSQSQVEEWVEFEIGASGSMSMDNPLSLDSLDAHNVIIRD